jgi:hypothetical protein
VISFASLRSTSIPQSSGWCALSTSAGAMNSSASLLDELLLLGPH